MILGDIVSESIMCIYRAPMYLKNARYGYGADDGVLVDSLTEADLEVNQHQSTVFVPWETRRKMLALHFASVEPYEGMKAFVEKRPKDYI